MNYDKCLKSYLKEGIFPPVAFRPDSGSWPSPWVFATTLIGHTTLGRTPLDE